MIPEPTLKSKACLKDYISRKQSLIYAVIWIIFRIFTPSIKRMTIFKEIDSNLQLYIYIDSSTGASMKPFAFHSSFTFIFSTYLYYYFFFSF